MKFARIKSKCHFKDQQGFSIVYTAMVVFIFSLVLLSALQYAITQVRLVRSTENREEAFQIAEAGINYYQWHLAHFQSDFWDGNASTTPGPYIHDYVDVDTQTTIGKFELTITPPLVGSTVVTIQSKGYTLADKLTTRTVTVKYGIPSLAKYAFLTNSDAWIGPNESVSGQFFTNGGLRFDGTGNAPIGSAKQTYNCQSWSGSPCPATESGIWGAAPQATKNFWQYPMPNIDFSTITSNLATMKSSAQSGGIYLPPSTKQGYLLDFQSNGTINFYKVTSLAGDPSGVDVNGVTQNTSTDYQNTTLLYNKPIPANGIIYIEDRVWVKGVVNGRVMVAAAVLPQPANPPDILIPNNITYLAKNGTNSLGLLAQGDILVTYQSPVNLEIDAALIAQTGSAQRYYYANNIKNTITIFGTTASYGTWTWSWTNANGTTCTSGYCTTNTVYDSNLLYSPPPSFPLSTSGYQQLNWTSN